MARTHPVKVNPAIKPGQIGVVFYDWYPINLFQVSTRVQSGLGVA